METIKKFEALVDKHFISQHDISFYENELGLKPKYLSKILKKHNALPPCQILLHKQIEHSKHLLLTTTMTVKEIAFEMNFEDPYYFSRVFKNKTAISPTAYRKKY